MKQRYVINIQNVDNLDDVQIEVSPFTIFTGDNNSGKTVIMNIIYGLFRLSREIIQNGDKNSHEYKMCKKFIFDLKNNGESYIDDDICSIFCNFFNMALSKNKDLFFSKIFNVSIDNNYQRFENTQIFLSKYRIFPRIVIAVYDFCDEIIIEGDFVKIPREFLNNEDYLIELICQKIIEDGFSDASFLRPIFMPAGRGAFLCYPQLFKNLKYQNLSIEDFIKNIENLKALENGVYKNIHTFLENEIINGSFTKDSYRCHFNDIEVPINFASDFIREISPFVLFLKSDKKFTSFFIEEIETHLNLKLQRNIVSALIKVVNMGTSIFMSTNSNIILDQICNFILLNNLNRNKIEGFGYVINDVLNSNDISIYEFIHDNNKVIVKRLPIDYRGFKIDFNDQIIDDISRENLQLKFEMFEDNK